MEEKNGEKEAADEIITRPRWTPSGLIMMKVCSAIVPSNNGRCGSARAQV